MLRTRTIGEYKVSSILEYIGPTHDPKATFTEYDRAGVEPHLGWIAPNHYVPSMDRFIIGIQIWVVQAGSDIILIDTGVGNHKPRFTERANMVNTLTLNWLAAAGIQEDGIYAVAWVPPQPPQALFEAFPLNGPAPLPVNFFNLSEGEYTNSLWEFGDSFTSNQQNPQHVYQQPGVYTVTLTVAGPGGSDSLVRPNYIVVQPGRGEGGD